MALPIVYPENVLASFTAVPVFAVNVPAAVAVVGWTTGAALKNPIFESDRTSRTVVVALRNIIKVFPAADAATMSSPRYVPATDVNVGLMNKPRTREVLPVVMFTVPVMLCSAISLEPVLPEHPIVLPTPVDAAVPIKLDTWLIVTAVVVFWPCKVNVADPMVRMVPLINTVPSLRH